MAEDLTILLIVAFTGIFGSVIGYIITHLLSVRERKMLREFEIRERGREFFHQTYAVVAVLSDLVKPYLTEEGDKARVLTEQGYILLPKTDIVKRYKEKYRKFAKFWCESREKGLEIFFTTELVGYFERFWAYAGYFNDMATWDKEQTNMIGFAEISRTICTKLDSLLGLNEKKPRIPKWLRRKNWRNIIRSGKT